MAATHGGEMVAAVLAAEDVDTVFGIIDGTYFGLYSNLEKHGIRLVSPRHETSALHMAGTYARLTGKLGVAIASNGPGVANALPGVAVESVEDLCRGVAGMGDQPWLRAPALYERLMRSRGT